MEFDEAGLGDVVADHADAETIDDRIADVGALSPILRSASYGEGRPGVGFWCPGCDEAHYIPVQIGVKVENAWEWNGSAEKPTLSPSILIRSGHHMPGWAGPKCYCNSKAPDGEDWGFTCRICHSFVTDGRIQFLGDCTHALVGQTVDLPAFNI